MDMGEVIALPGGPVIIRTNEIKVATPVCQILMRDFVRATIGIGNAFEPGNEIAVSDTPKAAIEWPAGEFRIVAIDDAVPGIACGSWWRLMIDRHDGTSNGSLLAHSC